MLLHEATTNSKVYLAAKIEEAAEVSLNPQLIEAECVDTNH